VAVTRVIYTSYPVKRVEAVAIVKAVHAEPPRALWRRVGADAAVSEAEFFARLGDLDIAYGIELGTVRSLGPLTLERAGPQSWRYLHPDRRDDRAILDTLELPTDAAPNGT
jgi:predicted transcriptional regulator